MLIFPPIIMNHILKVVYGHKKNNKRIHLTLGGLGDTALFDLLEGKNTKGFRKGGGLILAGRAFLAITRSILLQFGRPSNM